MFYCLRWDCNDLYQENHGSLLHTLDCLLASFVLVSGVWIINFGAFLLSTINIYICLFLKSTHNIILTVDSGAQTVSKLIGCTVSELNLALSTRKMKVGNDNIVQKLTLAQVCFYLPGSQIIG